MSTQPFRIGQKVVALIGAGKFIKGNTYTVAGLKQCKCGVWQVYILEFPVPTDYMTTCASCGGDNIPSAWYSSMRSFRFAPIEPLYADITSEIASQFKESIETDVAVKTLQTN